MAKDKRRVRDARFRDRDHEHGKAPSHPPQRPRPEPTPSRSPEASSAPPPRPELPPRPTTSTAVPSKGSHPGAVAHRRVAPSEATSSPAGPPWLSANLVVPAVLAVALSAAVYFMVRKPSDVTSESAAGASGDAGASADAGATNTAEGRPPTPAPTPTPSPTPTPTPSGEGGPVTPAHPEPSTPDPRHGRFTLADATAGLPGTGALVAEVETSMGNFECSLLSSEAPNTVANFVGLARGLRDFWDPVAGAWARRPFYDGSIFHRVIPGFMIQGGDVLRSGFGGTGYEFGDENVRGHDAAGQLCMANHGPNTNGGQFFITEAPRSHLDGSYSIFGRCTPTSLVQRIANVPRDGNDRPNSPVFIRHVRVRRGS